MIPPKILPGQILSAAEINAISQEIARQAKITATPPIIAVSSPGGVQLSYQPTDMYAIVSPSGYSGSGSGESATFDPVTGKRRYTIREAYEGPGGEYLVMANGRTGVGYERNNKSVPANSVVVASPGKKDGEWTFQIGGGGGTASGGGFPAKVTVSALTGSVVTYQIEEIETNPASKLPRTKVGGRVGPAYRGPSEEIDPPPIPVGQGVWATESESVPGGYEITPFGGMFRVSKRHLVKVEGTLVPNPNDCTTSILGILCYYQNERLSAREICGTYSPIGETPEGGT